MPYSSSVKKAVLLYGAAGGVLIAVLKLVEYRFLVVEHSLEIYGGLVAVVFAGVGVWLGLTVTRTKEVVVLKEVPASRVPFEVDEGKVLLSGAVSSAMMLASLPLIDRIGFDRGMLLGYTAIVLSFLLVSFGIRAYREQTGETISSGRAFTVGIFITLISCAFYVITWQIVYFKLHPEFADKFAAYAVEKARADGASDDVIEKTRKEMADFKALYDQPLYNAAFTFVEPFPVGLLVTLISAAALRKKR